MKTPPQSELLAGERSVELATRSKSEETTRRIEQAAARLFAARGFAATSIRDIATAAGVTQPTLYYHFGSKEGLAKHILLGPIQRLHDELAGLLRRHDLDPAERIERMIALYLELGREDAVRTRFLCGVFFGPEECPIARELARMADELDDLIRQAVTRLAQEGWIDPRGVERFVLELRGVLTITLLDLVYRAAEHPKAVERLAIDLASDLIRAHRSLDAANPLSETSASVQIT
ncbi:regulatory protein TetR [Isosphaera pallida ATCC 43644]|uniref:Regulatory protein TetR n=1 Tax=Isosphaera pallida (strain ATCC 43644 / DSM 9630 / IS1B) TaxID=575540 RepID=E8R197_ISOPI|nr:TetR/AcrR family transcriptional regulator [Isosphaera pallida]ADV61303.1 regulatory protein TetR [Isosphaera pallida ATCC 43644]